MLGASGSFKTHWQRPLEGLEPSPESLEIGRSYVEGEISIERAGELIRALPTSVVVPR